MRTCSAASLSPPTRWRPWRRSLTAAVTTWTRSSAGPEMTWTRWGTSSVGEDSDDLYLFTLTGWITHKPPLQWGHTFSTALSMLKEKGCETGVKAGRKLSICRNVMDSAVADWLFQLMMSADGRFGLATAVSAEPTHKDFKYQRGAPRGERASLTLSSL